MRSRFSRFRGQRRFADAPAEGPRRGAPLAPGGGRWRAARIVLAIAGAIAAVLALGILLVLLEANRDNGIVDFVLDVGRFFAGPFDDMFDLDTRKARVLVNWGIAAALYLLIGRLIARLLTR